MVGWNTTFTTFLLGQTAYFQRRAVSFREHIYIYIYIYEDVLENHELSCENLCVYIARSSAVADSFTTREDAKKQKALQEALSTTSRLSSVHVVEVGCLI